MKGFDLITPGWNRGQLEHETVRIFDVCDGCRRCFNLCPSFNTLFDQIDSYDSDLTKLQPKDFEQVEKECYYCKLCYNHCPYTPPHQYELDFPRLMAAWKKLRVAEQGASWRDRLLIHTDAIGKLGSLTAFMTNWILKVQWIRRILESVVGLHRKREILPFSKETFPTWWRQRSTKQSGSSAAKKVILFPSCMVNYQATDIGKATVQVLEKNGIEVVVPDGQHCCGMPSFDIGDTDTMTQAAQYHLKLFTPYFEKGHDLVIPTPSCSLMFKREYPYLCPSLDFTPMTKRTFDISEYLMLLKKDGGLSLEFLRPAERIAYQIPCHLRDQNIGFKSKELLELTGAKVEVIEKCSGHDGSWSAKVEYFDLSMKIARKAVRDITSHSPDLVASDCPLSALQLDQAGATHPEKIPRTLHPIQIIRNAYQLPS